MTFEIGARVKFNETFPYLEYHGLETTVEHICSPEDYFDYCVADPLGADDDPDGPVPWSVRATEITPV